jgi:uncharacterized protein
MSDRIQQIEAFARQHMTNGEVAHDYKHVDRVRRNALYIAQQEGYTNLDCVQAAALMHDVALAHMDDRHNHGKVGAAMAEQFMEEHQLFTSDEISEITHAIHWHDSVKKDDSPLLAILRDADMLELFGAVGLMRGFASRAALPDYDPAHVRGETWGMTARDFDTRFAQGKGTGPTMMDGLNFQISCYDNLNTETAKELARPLVDFMRVYADQLVREIEGSDSV